MNHFPTTTRSASRRVAAAGLALLASLAGVTSSAAVSREAPAPSGCHWSTQQLPRTPDAVEAWYEACRTPALGSPDAVEAWSR